MAPLVPFCDDESESEPESDDLVEIISDIDLIHPLPAEDMMTIQAKFPGPHGPSWSTIALCGDLGVGLGLILQKYDINFNTATPYSDAAGCPILPVEEGEIVDAHACILGCRYTIDDLTESSRVILAKIDGSYHILRVTSASLVTLYTKQCFCCDLGDVILEAEVIASGDNCEGYATLDPFELLPLIHGGGSWAGESGSLIGACGEKEGLYVTLQCNSPGGGMENINDWSGTICGRVATIDSLTCGDSESESESSDGSFELVMSASDLSSCCDCESLTIRITNTGILAKTRCWEDETIGEVIAEACGMTDLEPGDDLILAHIPGPFFPQESDSDSESESESDDGEIIEWFVVRACNKKDTCDVACEPPPDPDNFCCGVPCSEMPETLSATVEILTGECAGCTFGITFTKQGCDVGTVYISNDGICTNAGGSYSTGFLELNCNTPTEECGDDPPNPIFSLQDVFDTEYTLDLGTQCCSPLFLQFLGSTEQCLATMGPPFADVRITITG